LNEVQVILVDPIHASQTSDKSKTAD